MKQWPQIRDIGLFVGGMAGVVHETLITGQERPTLLILFAAMMGLPAFLGGRDEPQTVIIQEKPPEKKE